MTATATPLVELAIVAVFFFPDWVETANVGTRAIWDEIIEVLRAAPDPYECPELARLWALALEEAPRALARFRGPGRLDDERIADLTKDFLVEHLHALLDAVSPRAYFIVALQNSARSWFRKGSSRLALDERDDTSSGEDPAAIADPTQLIHARDFLRGLSQREYDVFVGIANGADREELARALDISRANLDQIVSRVRRRFRTEEP